MGTASLGRTGALTPLMMHVSPSLVPEMEMTLLALDEILESRVVPDERKMTAFLARRMGGMDMVVYLPYPMLLFVSFFLS